jgi:hypothetical protein
LGWGSKFMERFGNSALQFSSSRQSVAKTDLSTIPSIDLSTVASAEVEVPQRGTKLEASATVEADTCRKYVVPICLGGGGSLFCGLKTLAFSLQPLALLPLLRTGGSLPLSRRSETKTDCRAGLSRQNQMQAEAGRRREHSAFDCAFAVLAFSLQPLAFPFGVSDQLPSPI